uniref:DNA recombination protein RmuC n=1 Tax=candidate division WOR-3 bacterium TaxID=2052148 RepID=A0A7C4GGC2_UNCW3
MGTGSTILLVAAVAAFAGLFVVLLAALLRMRRPAADGQSLALLQQQLDALRQHTAETLNSNTLAVNQLLSDVTRQLNQRLAELGQAMQENTGQINTRLDNAARVVRDVSTGLGELAQATRQIYEVGKNIASLQEILRAPKLRGVIGELFLGDLLRQVVPNHHELQFRFRSGVAVDAVVRLGPRLVPIDAKFPLENFRRMLAAATEEESRAARRKFAADVKKHADTIAGKYILPDEGTFDFALMYIPAENVYYETVIRGDEGDESIGDYCVSRRVIPVSPSTLYANLQTIVLGLRGFAIEQRAGEIMDFIARLQTDFARFRSEFDTVGTHLNNARNRFEEAERQLSRFEERLALSVKPEPGHKPEVPP